MMLFKKFHIPLIQDNLKTETRRAWRKIRVKVGSVQSIKTNYFEKGSPHGKIQIDYIKRQKLGDMTRGDYEREGYGAVSPKVYQRIWENINGTWDPNVEVWVIGFHYLPNSKEVPQT